ncbi:hypothetical protein EI42_03627 [Thermosporothrix hazakensis]|jgi:hypothetical protein|uniref:Uncharacterized protein n=1 Tax=Thermosporothrix hazakensis TaxID=644383 RepID=A0A326U3P0_THEHA|nr:hypothetical protein EI42_03627 [Thermosporothrix hazakensis]GCE50349.1 hypothetical protein KTH_52180 [Thermosporothrix hazakensis]
MSNGEKPFQVRGLLRQLIGKAKSIPVWQPSSPSSDSKHIRSAPSSQCKTKKKQAVLQPARVRSSQEMLHENEVSKNVTEVA